MNNSTNMKNANKVDNASHINHADNARNIDSDIDTILVQNINNVRTNHIAYFKIQLM